MEKTLKKLYWIRLLLQVIRQKQKKKNFEKKNILLKLIEINSSNIISGNIEMVKLLIKTGANVNATSGYMLVTALHVAASRGKYSNQILFLQFPKEYCQYS